MTESSIGFAGGRRKPRLRRESRLPRALHRALRAGRHRGPSPAPVFDTRHLDQQQTFSQGRPGACPGPAVSRRPSAVKSRGSALQRLSCRVQRKPRFPAKRPECPFGCWSPFDPPVTRVPGQPLHALVRPPHAPRVAVLFRSPSRGGFAPEPKAARPVPGSASLSLWGQTDLRLL